MKPDAPQDREIARGPAQGAGRRGPCLVVALDLPSAREALALAEALICLPVWLKVGLELFCAAGPRLARDILAKRFAVFLDLKYHDIPNTVQSAVRVASRLGVNMLTLHACGGEAMCKAAVAGRQQAVEEGAASPLLMGVTVLTSRTGDARGLSALVTERALQARAWGLDGVVCSGHEAPAVKAACGSDFLCLCPGIRFAGHGNDDQARVCTPAQAVAQGADFVVMGRPVLRAASPAEAARRALREMNSAGGRNFGSRSGIPGRIPFL
jgi:orotidine-5'-phosphate decarboxylase